MGICTDYNIEEFGAKFDGMTDDTQAWKDAIQKIEQDGGGNYYFALEYPRPPSH